MVRGCQKKIIYLKSTGSEVFDEAYFVLSDKTPEEAKGDANIFFHSVGCLLILLMVSFAVSK